MLYTFDTGQLIESDAEIAACLKPLQKRLHAKILSTAS